MFPKGLVRLLIRSDVEAARPDVMTSDRILLLRVLSFGSAPFVLSGPATAATVGMSADLNLAGPDTLDGHYQSWSFRVDLIYSVYSQRLLPHMAALGVPYTSRLFRQMRDCAQTASVKSGAVHGLVIMVDEPLGAVRFGGQALSSAASSGGSV